MPVMPFPSWGAVAAPVTTAPSLSLQGRRVAVAHSEYRPSKKASEGDRTILPEEERENIRSYSFFETNI